MPSTPNITGAGRTVRIPESEIKIAERFTKSFLQREGDRVIGIVQVAVVLDSDGRPVLDELRYKRPQDQRPCVEHHPRLDLGAIVQWAYEAEISSALLHHRMEAEGVHESGFASLDLEDDELADVFAQAKRLGRQRGAYKITDDFLRDVLEQVRRSNVKVVAKEQDVSERSVRRWLTEARDRGLR